MKIAYIIITHRHIDQLKRLIQRLDHPGVSFVLHISPNCEPGFFEQVRAAYQDAANVFFTTHIPVYWGDITMVKASLNAIDTLVENGIDYDYAVLISGQDYPLQSHQTICDTLAAGEGRQFMEYFDLDEMEPDTRHRLVSTHLWIKNKHWWYPHLGNPTLKRKVVDGILSLFLPKERTLPNGYIGYKGSYWWYLTRDCIEYIHAFNQSDPGKRLLRYLRFSYHSAEYYFQTVLLNSAYRDQVINNEHRFTVWFEESGHPKILGMEDYEAMRASGKLFGRKFDLDRDAEIFDLLDADAGE